MEPIKLESPDMYRHQGFAIDFYSALLRGRRDLHPVLSAAVCILKMHCLRGRVCDCEALAFTSVIPDIGVLHLTVTADPVEFCLSSWSLELCFKRAVNVHLTEP